MRALSQQVVNTQEEERKHLSRELHDHVAQVLTGLRMELGRIERRRSGVGPRSPNASGWWTICSSRSATSRLVLRPSMLDDFGLRAALEWHARDFMSRSAVNVDLDDRRRPRVAARETPHLRVSRRAGGD